MSDDDALLQEHAVRRARLTAALLGGRRRSWADRRGTLAPLVGGAALAAVIAFGVGVTAVVSDQLAQTRQTQREQQERQRQQSADDASRRSPTPPPASSPAPGQSVGSPVPTTAPPEPPGSGTP